MVIGHVAPQRLTVGQAVTEHSAGAVRGLVMGERLSGMVPWTPRWRSSLWRESAEALALGPDWFMRTSRLKRVRQNIPGRTR
jgi:hypothetical protein